MRSPHIRIAEGVTAGGGAPLLLIAGPDSIESEAHALKMAHALKEIARARGVPLVYKSSFDKANRTSIGAFRGPGMKEGLRILAKVKEALSKSEAPEAIHVRVGVVPTAVAPSASSIRPSSA